MAIRQSQAIVIKSMPYGETSKILTVLSADHGRISLLAKGARDTKSKYGGALELFTHVNIVYYEKDNRELQLLSEASVITSFFGLQDNLDRLYPALAMLEVCNRVMHSHEEHARLFELLRSTLDALSRTNKRPLNGFLFFMTQLANVLGYRVEAQHCDFCADPLTHDHLRFSYEYGRVVCNECPQSLQSTSTVLSKEAAAVLAHFNRSDAPAVFNIALSGNANREVYGLLLKHLQYHLDELSSLKTLAFLNAS